MYVVNTEGEHEEVQCYSWCTPIERLPIKWKWLTEHEKYGKREHWVRDPLFIDTETSHKGEEYGWVHQWAIAWQDFFIIGRRAEELTSFLAALNDHITSWASSRGYNPKNWKALCYIHNLSYDMEYLRGFFPESEPKFFAVKPHRVLTAKWNQIEIRCSYLLTQKSLEKWGKDSKAKHPKLSGTYDYDRIITPIDPLSESDWAYQLNDCACMHDSWYNDRKYDGYTVLDVPLTSTGFVRADCRKAAFEDYGWPIRLREIQPSIDVYNALEEAFAGGYTHGNRFYKQHTVSGPIGHRDFLSSYPARQMLNLFPMGPWRETEVNTVEEVISLMQTQALLLHVAFRDPELKDRSITAPYMSAAKLYRQTKTQDLLDNGRVIKLKGVVHMWLTEYDLIIILRQYRCDYQIVEAYSSAKGRLPKWMRTKVMEYFRNKTTLKHTDEVSYMWGKAKLNGIYGMTAERYIRNILTYDDGEWTEERVPDQDREAALNKSIKKKTCFLPFAWGTWTTALARYALFECIETIGYDKFLYCDTDSIFYLMNDDTEEAMDRYNQRIIQKADSCGASIDYEGKHYALGEFTPEDDMPLRKFRHVHAKCYATIDNKGKLHCTVAGVTKKQRHDRKKSNADELGCIDNLEQGFVFDECGGTRIVYINEKPHEVTVNGCDIFAASAAIILPTQYIVNDLDNLDLDDEMMAEIILGNNIADTYGPYWGIK